MQSKATSKIQLKEPELDLLILEVFKARYREALKKNPSLLNQLPFLEITKLDGTKRRGLLVYAKEWNPPPGCLRIISLDEYSTEKITFITDTSCATYHNEVADQWTKAVKDNRSIVSSAKAKDTKSKGLSELPDDFFADKKRGVFRAFEEVDPAVNHMEDARVRKEQ